MQEAAEQGVPRAHGVDDFPHLHGGQGENAVFLPEVHGRALGSPAENDNTVSVSVPQRPQKIPVVSTNSLVAEEQNIRAGHEFPVEFVVDVRKHMDICGHGFAQRLRLMQQRAIKIDVAGGHHVGVPANVLREVVGRFLNVLQVAVDLPLPLAVIKHHGVGRLLQSGFDPVRSDSRRAKLALDIFRREVPPRHGKQSHVVPQGFQCFGNVVRHAGHGGVHPEKGVINWVIVHRELPHPHGRLRVDQPGYQNVRHIFLHQTGRNAAATAITMAGSRFATFTFFPICPDSTAFCRKCQPIAGILTFFPGNDILFFEVIL